MLNLQHGRTLTVQSADGGAETVEIRSQGGLLELRIKLTDDGVALQFEGAHISLKAAESVDVECKTFSVNADAGVHIEAGADLRLQGRLIYLN